MLANQEVMMYPADGKIYRHGTKEAQEQADLFFSPDTILEQDGTITNNGEVIGKWVKQGRFTID